MTEKYSVLVVDDETSIRNTCKKILKKKANVKTAGSAEEGRAVLASETFDVVLLDVMLPGMGGMEFLKEIKEKYPATEVIIITGKPEVESAVSAMKTGAMDYIVKPFGVDILRELVEQAVSAGRVLIVDDDEGVIEAIRKIVSRKFPDISLDIMDEGTGVVEAVEGNRYGLIFMDIGLKGLNGLDIVKELVEKKLAAPGNIVIMTGYSSAESRSLAEDLGIKDFLTKPFFVETITDLIEKKLGRKARQ